MDTPAGPPGVTEQPAAAPAPVVVKSRVAARTQADSGFYGEIYAARSVWHRRSGIPGFGSWFTRSQLSGGGSLLDIGIHALDRALFIMDYPTPVTVSGVTFS